MRDFFVVLLSSAGVSAALSVALVWLARTWIGERLRGAIQTEYAAKLETLKAQLKADADLQVESHKATLNAQNAVELEKLRSALATAAAERNVQYGALVQRRFEAIAAVYASLRRLHRSVTSYVSPVGDVGGTARDAARTAVREAERNLIEILDERAVFLPRKSADLADGIRALCERSARQFLHGVDIANDMPSGADVQVWMKVTEQIEGDAVLAVKTLEMEFRTLMGDAEEL
ncbi:hypothetical protein C2U71_07200 [Burkholderia ubonensis]|nr:hypothetical protein C2U71_07200 [Burkholderia ubonensis]